MATEKAAPASELERRKQVKIRLRSDLRIEPQKYEGKTYYVVKDPVSLRYYRLKDHENYLLGYLDGEHTLDDAQKAYEKHYRPDRLKLEDLESFAQQLLTAGLAQNDSPRAGKQLFDRRKKRRRSEWMQTLTNILYIKIPIFDPERLLKAMLGYVGWIFSMTFFVISVAFMLSAVLLVATHFETFRSKLPNYHEFFSFKTVVYLWVALGAVKIIHEFGHGLSCKVFGGEVHEMGALFLCLSPALYCNVSDAWTLPNKWHRIVISAAGIYVELVIAAAATFVWWNTPSHPFVNNLSLSLMVVCSVSTVVFNANPLMRYDGYYVLADWLEIPNLRERSNRFLTNMFLEHCLGIETLPEPYMQLGRRILFVTYALASYIYRWVVTFSILYFMDSFLKPYKLEVISHLLTLAAVGSLVGWPIYRLGKNLYKRGRLPDMKRWRVVATSSVAVLIVLFVCLVPVPIGGRIRGQALIQPVPDDSASVFVIHPGVLEDLKVRAGQHVEQGDELARFTNRELQAELGTARAEADIDANKLDVLRRQLEQTTDEKERIRLQQEMAKTRSDLDSEKAKAASRLRMISDDLVLRAPCSGTIGTAPRPEDVGKTYEVDPTTPFCTIYEPGRLRICLPVPTPEFNRLKEEERPSAAAKKTRRRLQSPVTIAYHDTPLRDVLHDLTKQAKGPTLALESPGSHEADLPVTAEAKGVPLGVVLDRILDPMGMGYYILSDENNARDGQILLRPGPERGVAVGTTATVALPVTVRIQGRDWHTWHGRLWKLPESEAKEIPMPLSNRGGGPVAVKAGGPPGHLVPQTQYYLVYIDLIAPDAAIAPGNMAQVKIHCRPETCLHWLWRTVNTTFDLGLI
jgi:putative peptide zinc metalloprotease protein